MAILDPLELSKILISKPSVTPVDAGALDALEGMLKPLGFACHRLPFTQESAEEVDNLYARLGKEGRHLNFAGHTDVVPPGNESDWQSPPFEPTIRGGVLYGRGACDMKCAVACFVAACAEYIAANGAPKGSISLLITGDEEGPAVNGTIKLVDWLKENNYGGGTPFDLSIVGEPTNPAQLGDMVKIGRRGSISYSLTVEGTQGHSAYPHLADNPVTRMVNILSDMQNHVLDNGMEWFQPSNLQVTNVDVGNKASNVIPARAKATFSVRFNPHHSCASLTKWADEICARHAERYTLTPETGCEAFLTEPGKYSEMVQQAVKEVTGALPALSTTGGTSDARFIKDLCPVVECGGINQTAHKVDENMAVEDIHKLKDIYLKIIEKFFA